MKIYLFFGEIDAASPLENDAIHQEELKETKEELKMSQEELKKCRSQDYAAIDLKKAKKELSS